MGMTAMDCVFPLLGQVRNFSSFNQSNYHSNQVYRRQDALILLLLSLLQLGAGALEDAYTSCSTAALSAAARPTVGQHSSSSRQLHGSSAGSCCCQQQCFGGSGP
jgi:hypothetical protein